MQLNETVVMNPPAKPAPTPAAVRRPSRPRLRGRLWRWRPGVPLLPVFRSALVRPQTVADLRGATVDSVIAAAERHYVWVWDVGTGGRRSLRFWSEELLDPEGTAGLCLSQVLERLLPRPAARGGRDLLRNQRVVDLLRVHRGVMAELRDELECVEHQGEVYVSRRTLEQFLRRRWLAKPAS